MRPAARVCLVLMICAALFVSPSLAAHRRALGVVSATDRGHLDSKDAKVGADIYSCDSLDTNDGGDLRVRIGANQLYLSAMSSAQLEDDRLTVQVLAESGTVAFSEPSTGNISIRTPAGTIRAEGAYAVAGEVTYKNANELVITAMKGNLTLDTNGQLREIPQGKSADVTFEDALSEGCHDEGGLDENGQFPRAKIAFYYIIPEALAIPSYLLWQEMTESESKPE
jgi:hypothetical protein